MELISGSWQDFITVLATRGLPGCLLVSRCCLSFPDLTFLDLALGPLTFSWSSTHEFI